MPSDYDYLLDPNVVESIRVTDDARRPRNDAYLTRADTVLGPEDVRRAQELEASGMVRPQIADALGCNLRDVFRALEGNDYLERFAREHITRDCRWDRTAERERDILSLMQAGVNSVEEIGASYRVSREFVKSVAKKHGYHVRKGRWIISPEQIKQENDEKKAQFAHKIAERNQKIVQVLKSTELTYQQIADRFGLSRHSVRRIAFQNNCQRRTPPAELTPEEAEAVARFKASQKEKRGDDAARARRSLVDPDEILALVQCTSLTYQAIAASFGVSEAAVQKVAQSHGITKQNRPSTHGNRSPNMDTCLLLLRGTALSYRKIAQETALSETHVRKLAAEHGLANLRKRADNSERYILVDKLLRNPGISMRKIHQQTGLSMGSVVNYNRLHRIR